MCVSITKAFKWKGLGKKVEKKVVANLSGVTIIYKGKKI